MSGFRCSGRSHIVMSKGVDPDEFIKLHTAHEARLRGYILTLVPRWADAEEIGQRCSMILWKKFDRFEPGTNFFAWACQIARLEVKDLRRRQSRERVIFSDEFVDKIADEAVRHGAEYVTRMEALQQCVQKLSHAHRELLRLRYDEQRPVGSVAKIVNRPIEGVYKALSRIRQTLHLCINARLATGDV